MNALEARKAAIEKMVENMKGRQEELRKAGGGMNALQQQLQENVLVKEELSRVADGAKVYKLVGPVLIPQELEEAKGTVEERMSFISAEVEKAAAKVKAMEKENQEAQMKILKEQEEFQAQVQKAAAADPSIAAAGR